MTPSTPRRRDRWRVGGLCGATALSVGANAMVAVVLPWLVLSRTGSAGQAGLVGAVSLAAAVGALLLGGPVIDRWGRRRTSVTADLLSATAVLTLPLVETTVGLTLAATLALVAVGALGDAPGAAAREAARPRVAAVAGRGLSTVNAAGEAGDGAGRVLGPTLAGAAIGGVGAVGSLWAAAAALLLAAALTWWALPADGAPAGTAFGPASGPLGGLRRVWSDRGLRAVTLVGVAAMAVVTPLTLVLTALLVPQDRGGALGLLLGSLSAGTVVGAVGFGLTARRLPWRPLLLACLTTAGLAVGAMAVAPGTGWLLGAAAATGCALGPVFPLAAQVLQERTGEDERGRVVTAVWALSLGAAPAAVLCAGLLLDATSPAAVLLGLGAGLWLTALAAATSPALREVLPDGRGPARDPGCGPRPRRERAAAGGAGAGPLAPR